MQEVLTVALLGAGIGAMYALAAQGLVLIYRGSGVLNFAHGAVAVSATYFWYELYGKNGWPFVPAFVAALVASGIVGALIHLLVMRPLRGASPLARTIATLGLLVVFQSIVVLRYGTYTTVVPHFLPINAPEVWGVSVPADRMILVGVAVALSVGLWAFYRFTKFGRATSAVAENQDAAATLGISPDVVAATNWAFGAALAAVAGILASPILQLQVGSMTSLLLAALAAALVARFRSFAIVIVASLVIGIGQAELIRWVTDPNLAGLAPALPFVVIVVVMAVRGHAIPLRDFLLERLPKVGSGRIRPIPALAAIAATIVLLNVLSDAWANSIGLTLGFAAFMLGYVVLLGYSGQISLAQWGLAGFAAWVAGRLVAGSGLPLLAGMAIGIIATIPAGLVLALPALRTRGINLALATFGLGTALEAMIFTRGNLTGGYFGTTINLQVGGWKFDTALHPARYAYVALGAFVILALLVANLRRGKMGRRMLSVRNNERAATALGIDVRSVKLYAFAVAAGIAAVGGLLVSFAPGSVDFTQFAAFASVQYAMLAFLGGIGFIIGPILAATFVPGTVGTEISTSILPNLGRYLGLIGGIFLVLMVLFNQDGMAAEMARHVRLVTDRLPRLPRRRRAVADVAVPPAASGVSRVQAKALDVRGVTVRYGTVTALQDLSLTVTPGRVTGLIGPNGAGKTTLIDAVTGFTRMAAGTVLLDGRDLAGLSPVKRARAGIGRSFQSLELFEDMTVLENIFAASDSRSWRYGLTDLVWPAQSRFSPELAMVVKEFQLQGDLASPATSLPYGRRRLLAIARAVATRPSVLLLDEPAAGLSGLELRELAHVVRRLAADWGIAVLLIEHDMEFVFETCDEIVAIDFGRKIASGTPAEIRADPAVVAAYLGTRAGALAPSEATA
jgi:sulfate-transporting ATPase